MFAQFDPFVNKKHNRCKQDAMQQQPPKNVQT